MILHEMLDRSGPSGVRDGVMSIEDRSNIWKFSIHGAFRLARVLDGFGTVLETKKKNKACYKICKAYSSVQRRQITFSIPCRRVVFFSAVPSSISLKI